MSAPWQALLDWWFGDFESAAATAAARNTLWFGKRKGNDTEARERFGDLVEQALNGGLQHWLNDPQGWLATIVLLDQLPRMIYRDTPRAWSGDARAQALLHEGLRQGHDLQLSPVQRSFAYLVLEHSEHLDDQNLSLACFTRLLQTASDADRAYLRQSLDYAERHQRIVERFGRFPHRNAVLGRTSSAEEIAFLKTPGSSF